ncbi:hypothetical protein IIA79_01055 [bacterium]|nr:hypothetical protein [bacterium]
MRWEDGRADIYDHLEIDGHFVFFNAPEGWDKSFSQELMVYGRRYGEVGSIRATIVIWGAQTKKTAQLEDAEDSLVIYGRKQFPLADAPDEPAWFSIPLDVIELPEEFAVSLFTYSNEERGLEIGLSRATKEPSHSSSGKPGLPESEEGELALRFDGREWLIRMKIRSTLIPGETIDAGDLTGSQFTFYDDGEAEGFTTVQKHGPMIHVENSRSKTVDRIYVYAKVEGDWYKTERTAGVYLLDSRFAIIARSSLSYNGYTSEPSWNYASFDDAKVPSEFYVLIEPASRPQVILLIGYDSSGINNASAFGTAGALLNWELQAPEENTNWMIRVRYP